MRLFLLRFVSIGLILLALSGGAVAQDSARPGHYGLPVDWSHRFVVSHAQLSDADFVQTALTEPRILYNWVIRHPASARAGVRGGVRGEDPGDAVVYRRPVRPTLRKRQSLAVDWHFPLGAGTVPIGSAPSKYGFDLSQTPNCTNG
jgi:hypothetical protein